MPTPKELNFRMPAEWEKHEATWLVWPTDPDTFPPDIMAQTERVYLQMIEALCDGERVNLLVDDEATKERVRKCAGDHRNLVIHLIKTQDVWIRDYGPTFVTNGKEVAMNVWQYNAYGGKWPELAVDTNVPYAMQKELQLRTFESGIFLEGGGLEVNGSGTCLTTESCLLNKNRNAALGRADIESYLQGYLNVSRIIWLYGGVVSGDDTDGHIDNIARFVNSSTVVCVVEEDTNDQNYATLRKNFETLKAAGNDHLGKPLTIIPLPMPGAVINKRSGRLPASYANFYIGNTVVLVPVYNHRHDERVLTLLSEFFPTRQMVPIDATPLVWGFGSIHCVTQQQPMA